MRKYLDRSASEKERKDLLHWVSSSRPEEVDGLWNEVWERTDDSVTIDELEWESLLKEVAGRKVHKNSSRVILRRVAGWAAAAAVLTAVFFAAKWMMTPESEMIYRTGFGETLKIVLEDGTKVDLNADSRLVWKKDWRSQNHREVYLEGEAYFDVEHIDMTEDSGRMPFDVQTQDVTIHVMGTAFNATSRRGKTEVLLEEGLIELSLKRLQLIEETKLVSGKESDIKISDKEESSDDADLHVLRMTPGDWISFSAEEDILVQKTKDEIEKTLEWKDGTLSYQDVEFRFMLENLEDIYGKTFDVSDSALLQTRVDVGVPYEDWETVIDMMKWMLDVELIETGDNQVSIKRKEN